MKNFDEIKSVLSETQRYIKLTRALILSRVLTALPDLEIEQRKRMETQLAEIKMDLGLNEESFGRALADLEKKHEQSFQDRRDKNKSDGAATASDDSSGKIDSSTQTKEKKSSFSFWNRNSSKKGDIQTSESNQNGSSLTEEDKENSNSISSSSEITMNDNKGEKSLEINFETKDTESENKMPVDESSGRVAHCLNKNCRHKFKVSHIPGLQGSMLRKCTVCGSSAIFLLDSPSRD